ncbi:MAG: hypothetical protein HC802_20910, partial [Caldilineaceae bacterium]|nr:hypothetical protein [Caldilineaceae bacterium]
MATSTVHRPRLKSVLPRTWWLILLRGLAGIVLGFTLFSQSALNLVNLAIFMGLYWAVDGIFMVLVSLFVRPAAERWWLLLLRGLIGLAAGVYVITSLQTRSVDPFVDPSVGHIWLLATIAVLSGVVDIVFSARIREVVE